MENKNLYDKLNWMKSELTALKTAHDRGLGVFDFYTKTVTYTALAWPDNYINVIVTVYDGEQTPPFVQIGCTDPYYCQLQSVAISNNNRTLTYKFFANDYYVPAGRVMTFRAVSISRIQSITAVKGSA